MDEPVSVAKLSKAAGVSERSLRNAFCDVRGMSPKRCTVRARLDEVRRALCAADGERGLVTTLAMNHGFFELGRFASLYKAAYGETPSTTLRSRGDGARNLAGHREDSGRDLRPAV
jgi:AraC family transcriptional regulator, ethanolamine operon transcriptional activator